jgi:hypothetical protein
MTTNGDECMAISNQERVGKAMELPGRPCAR